MSQPSILLLARADGRRVDTPFSQQALSAADPFAASRQVAWSGSDGVAAGIIAGRHTVASDDYPHSETIVVHSGQVTLKTPDQTLQLTVGGSAVIGRGSVVQIEAQEGTQWAFCSVTTALPTPGLTLVDPLALLSPSAAPEPQILIGPTPQCRSRNAFEDHATDLRVGVWDSTPYTRHGRGHKLNELMHLIEGSVTLTADDGANVTVDTGDSVFVALGAPCAWQSTRYVRKVYAVK